ncbi:unnamed protein product [Clonostachys rosea]|uniref:Cytochrome b5 heme-binding domain-containing protein n=1 Tax=Bionectria ochroleuca TaxID=29856 RepID=A0ABY6U6S9_BIOOC|nr:unnamed protein product [Clonostachys rosea]
MPSASDVASHSTPASCWVIIAGNAYDVTTFIDVHPGGRDAIMRYAGKDATEDYESIHAPSLLKDYADKVINLGLVEGLSFPTQGGPTSQHLRPGASGSYDSPSPIPTPGSFLPLNACKSLEDFERSSQTTLSAKAAAYFNSGAESLSTLHGNRKAWANIRFCPRVLRDVTRVDMTCSIMGSDSTMPVFIAPAAAARLAHPDAELGFARGAARMGVVQCVCTYASVKPQDIMDCFQTDPWKRGGALTFQLYVPQQKERASQLIQMAKDAGFRALVVTVDSPVIGKRDDDDRFKALADSKVLEQEVHRLPPLPGQEAETLRGVHCPALIWDDLHWIRAEWGDNPIILKGIQTAEDALKATMFPVDGIYLSNHGGRQLDYAPNAVEVLLEIRQKHPEVFDKLEIYADGGVMRGTDVVKALCLGARGVGLGRGFLYPLASHGTDGVLRAIQILSDEIQTTMRLLGVTKLSQLDGSYITYGDGGLSPNTKSSQSKL